ncbi:acidic mammalian chitinase-like [Rhipicephalus microplus]|uniref:acidic mammalian chitinase-like n=1 Tax=Rhipicephalus microplus TaxID=6941 RepID=UPI003F6D09D9
MLSQRRILSDEEPRLVSGWLVVTQRKYGLFLAVVGVTSLVTATLFAFAGMAQQHVRETNVFNEDAFYNQGDADESMYVIKKAFEENSEPSPNLNLLCRFSARYRTGVYPYGVCTHFIYASVPNRPGSQSPHGSKDVLYSYDPAAFKKFLHLRDLAGDVRLLLSVDLDAMLQTGWSPKRLASDARVWLDRSGVDGLHLDGLEVMPRSIHNVSKIVAALRQSFKKQYLLTIGIDRTQKIVEDELLHLLELVDFASFSTSHIRHMDERTTLSNPYTKYENSTSGQFLGREVGQLAKLAARSPKSQVCFTLVLGGNQFQLRDSSEHGLGAPAKHVRDVSYSEICKRQWTEVKYIEPAIGFYAHSGKTWVGYDTEKTIAAKVQLAMRKYPHFCVMLIQVDKDDVRGICSERHFPLVQSVKHAMRHYHRQAPAPES